VYFFLFVEFGCRYQLSDCLDKTDLENDMADVEWNDGTDA